MKKRSISTREGCHICSSWTPLNGCGHRGPDDYDLNKKIIKEIVTSVHGSIDVIETGDFYAGINATLIYLRKNKLIK